MVTKSLALRISIFNTLGFFIATVGPIYINGGHYRVLERGHVWEPPKYWVSIFSILVFLIMYTLLRLRGASNSKWLIYITAATPIIICVPVLIWNFDPNEFIFFIFDWILPYSFINFLTLFVHLQPLSDDYLDEKNVAQTAKIERVKEQIIFWRTFATVIMVSYMGILATWIIFSRISEKILVLHVTGVTILSIFFLSGLMAELLQKIRLSSDLLLRVRQ